ncbi:MAG: FAD-dependent oxidoreductase [Bacteroidetes bacterium]|nr:FAD-dependent oxidoreductase [Bacteroidota bacterium]
MFEYRYLIVGGGMTADSAVKGIRQVDPSSRIGIISDESNPPYNRPPLSKALWKGEPLTKLWRGTPMENVEVHVSTTAKSIDTERKRVVDDKGEVYAYGKLLLATGVRVRSLPWKAEGIINYRTLSDYQRLRQLTEKGENFAVIGGGFTGSEIAAALTMNHKSVTMIFPEEGIGARIYPPPLARYLNGFFQSKGIDVRPKTGIESIEKRPLQYMVKIQGGTKLRFDGVVAGIGATPNQELAASAGLEVGNGILVDGFLRTTHPDIYAAGDVANFYNPAQGKRMRVEHEDNALTMGEVAGKNMAGETAEYHHQPFFYSDLFELGYEAVGDLDSRFEMVQEWKDEFREGVVYYLNESRVRGVLLWNVWGQVDAARALIAENGPFTAETVRQRIPA